MRVVLLGGPKFGLAFRSKRVTVPKTHFLYAVVQYTQVRTSTAVSSQSTSGEPRNLAASPQPSGRGSIQVPWRLLLRQAYAAPPSVVGRPRRRLMISNQIFTCISWRGNGPPRWTEVLRTHILLKLAPSRISSEYQVLVTRASATLATTSQP